MAITAGYATLVEFKAWKDISSTDATDDSVIEDIIEAVSRYIDGETGGRTFYARTETRYFDVPSGRELPLDDDLLTITTLTNGDDSTIASSAYNLVPKNEAPYNAIRLLASSTVFWTFDGDGNSEWVISVAGTWGYASTAPHDIRQACLQIAHSYYQRRYGDNVSSDAVLTTGGVVISPRDIPGIAAKTIKRYLRRL